MLISSNWILSISDNAVSDHAIIPLHLWRPPLLESSSPHCHQQRRSANVHLLVRPWSFQAIDVAQSLIMLRRLNTPPCSSWRPSGRQQLLRRIPFCLCRHRCSCLQRSATPNEILYGWVFRSTNAFIHLIDRLYILVKSLRIMVWRLLSRCRELPWLCWWVRTLLYWRWICSKVRLKNLVLYCEYSCDTPVFRLVCNTSGWRDEYTLYPNWGVS